MDQTILLNGNTSPLGQRLSNLFIDDGAYVVRADEGEPGRSSDSEEEEDHLTIIP